MLNESGLHRMKLVAIRESFDCSDASPLVHDRESETGVNALSVDENRACAALSQFATFLDPGQMKPIS